jgi:hypothetical protein
MYLHLVLFFASPILIAYTLVRFAMRSIGR